MGKQCGGIVERTLRPKRIAADKECLADPIAAMRQNEILEIPLGGEMPCTDMRNRDEAGLQQLLSSLDLQGYRLAFEMREKNPRPVRKRGGKGPELRHLRGSKFDRDISMDEAGCG